jgi:histone H3/H4
MAWKSGKKSATKGAKKAAKKSTKKGVSFGRYISKVLRGASKTKLTMSSKAMKIVDSFVKDQFEAIAVEAAALARGAKKRTLGSREMQTAVRLTLPAELAKHAMAEGTRAVAKASS